MAVRFVVIGNFTLYHWAIYGVIALAMRNAYAASRCAKNRNWFRVQRA